MGLRHYGLKTARRMPLEYSFSTDTKRIYHGNYKWPCLNTMDTDVQEVLN